MAGLAAVFGASVSSAQAPSLALHGLDFYVHVDTLAFGSDLLSDYQAAIDDALIDARLILQGEQGPVDSPCCTELTRLVAVTPFGSPGDGLHMIDFGADLPALRAAAGGRDAVFIVDALSFCGGIPAASAIGCAETGGAIQVVTLGAIERDLLGATIAHERGHNAGLDHVTANDCDMMQPMAGGACLPAEDCVGYRLIATHSEGTCPCLADAASKLADGSACVEGALDGSCSGGLCGDNSGEAAAVLVGAVDPLGGLVFDQLATGSGLTGDWQLEATLGGGAIVTGLAYAADRGVLYGVGVAGSDGELIEIDPVSGSFNRTIPLAGLPGLISLAYDPGGAGSADDRLLAVDRQPLLSGPMQIEELIEIDPDDGTFGSLCSLATNSHETALGFYSGLAYDAANDRLLGSGGGGLFEIDPVDCAQSEIDHPGTAPKETINLARFPGALGYSAAAERVFMFGNQSGSRTLFTVTDAGAVPAPQVSSTLGVDSMTPGGLAAMPIPEPPAGLLGLSALLTLTGLRRHSTAMRPTPRPPGSTSSPTVALASAPLASSTSRSRCSCSGATASSSPPEVCASHNSSRSTSPRPAA